MAPLRSVRYRRVPASGSPREIRASQSRKCKADDDAEQRDSERQIEAMPSVNSNRRGRQDSCGNEDRDQQSRKLHARRESRTKASI
jgi:hypothetical protein